MTEQVPLTTSPLPYKLTVEDFFRLDDAGAFEGYGKTELIRGEVYYMNAQHRPHARAKAALYDAIRDWIGAHNTELALLSEATVAMAPNSAPEPDLILTTEPDGEGPVPIHSVRLLVEIADTTQKNDLRVKAELYAEHGVPEYWVVDLKAQRVHRMWLPGAEGYTRNDEAEFGGRLVAATIDGLSIELPPLR
ncbi:MAG: Uma2 family endonuclease [Novosphingobium sp.]